MSQSNIYLASLRPWQVVVREEDEPKVSQALESLSCRQRPRPRDSRRVTLAFAGMEHAHDSLHSIQGVTALAEVTTLPDNGVGNCESTFQESHDVTDDADAGGVALDCDVPVQRTFIHFSEAAPMSPRTSAT